MAVKKSSSTKAPKRTTHTTPPVDHIPDIFDEDGASSVIPSVRPSRGPMVVEVEDVTVDVIEPTDSFETVSQVSTEEADLPMPIAPMREPDEMPEPFIPPLVETPEEPTFTVRTPTQAAEPALPSFFTETVGHQRPSEASPSEESNVAAITTQDTSMLEAIIPQAFVGEVREVAAEAKQEKKGALVTFFIILGMVLVAAGVVGLYVVSTRANSPQPSPSPLVEATPVPTPIVTVSSATETGKTASEAGTLVTTKLKVNVLNGTPTKGLAAKEAAVLKKAGYTLGTVGNGDPKAAGTITVPTGQTDVATGIQTTLSDFTFTVTEDAKATAITVVLGE